MELMKKGFPLVAVFIVVSLLVSACGSPPPLKSDKYLADTSLVSGDASCAPPCFRGITVGKTTFSDALSMVKADTSYKDVQSTDKAPFQAAWAAKDGEMCCQMSANEAGLINAILVRTKPTMTIKQVIDKYGKPDYVATTDYSEEEALLGLIFTKPGLIIWVTPGNKSSTLKETDPVVAVLYSDPNDMQKLIETGTLQGWNGYQPYEAYKTQTPVVTPKYTLTPGSTQ
jgi:hypothetical protein